ncbi:hypothetical protein [Providencia sp. PROV156]|uniref:hypothetical protein n=1 Tax=Providencia sp. PROV156 TaxID=2949866 RepID=UPI00234AEC06|nr:hypothetical protein [Providencia sp. PROV156]
MLVETKNVSSVVREIACSGLATYTELTTTLGLEDAMNLLEIHHVNEYNKQVMKELSQQQ